MEQFSMVEAARLDAEDARAVQEGFARHNAARGYPGQRLPLALSVRDADGALAGALEGYMFYDWLTVSMLWVREDCRGKGIGGMLLAQAESIAAKQGCVGSTLSTYAFQARPFYESKGYAVFGTLPDNPMGCPRYFMQKPLAPGQADAVARSAGKGRGAADEV